MQTVQHRPFSFLGQPKSGGILLLAALALATGTLTGCSTSGLTGGTGQAAAPAGSLGAQDAYASSVGAPGVLSMAAGDSLGMAVYAQDYQLARSNNTGSIRMARNRHVNPNTVAQPTVASVDDQR